MASFLQTEALTIIGIEVRTTNERAFTDIPLHWQRFFQEAILDRIPNKVSDDVYAVYTNFEHPGKDNEGTYSFILGAQVTALDLVPPPFVATVISPSKREVFPVASGHPETVGQTWQYIWGRSDLKKTFLSDYERYQPSGEIAIFVGVEEM